MAKTASQKERDELAVIQEQHKANAEVLLTLVMNRLATGELTTKGLIQQGKASDSDDRYVYQISAGTDDVDGLLTLMFSFKARAKINKP